MDDVIGIIIVIIIIIIIFTKGTDLSKYIFPSFHLFYCELF